MQTPEMRDAPQPTPRDAGGAGRAHPDALTDAEFLRVWARSWTVTPARESSLFDARMAQVAERIHAIADLLERAPQPAPAEAAGDVGVIEGAIQEWAHDPTHDRADLPTRRRALAERIAAALAARTPAAPAPEAGREDVLAPREGERRVAAFDVRIYATTLPGEPEAIATKYRAVVRGVETGTLAESTSPVGTWALLRAIQAGARTLHGDLAKENA